MLRGQAASGQNKTVPTITFCEMVKHPELYFEKTIRFRGTFEIHTEGSTLNDELCPRSHDDSIGLSVVKIDDKQLRLVNREFGRIRSGKVGVHPRVIVVGILRNVSRRAFEWYRYRFDIIRFENIQPEGRQTANVSEGLVPYQSVLDAGKTYRAVVRGDKEFGLVLVPPLRLFSHQAVSIEWTNLKEFPALERLRDSSRQLPIVFSVISDERKQMTEQRWDRTVKCKILRIE